MLFNMKIHRFFLEEKIDDGKILTVTDEKLLHQWSKVFRFKKGAEVFLFDGTGSDFPAEFLVLTRQKAELKVSERIENNLLPKVELTLCPAVIKKDNFEWVVQKGTELGVSAFVPILSDRSEKKDLNLERLRLIAKEAVEQSGWPVIPKISQLVELERVLDDAGGSFIALHSSGSVFSRSIFTKPAYKLLIGPEGGWSDREITLFKVQNIPVVSMGGMTLRAETAAIVSAGLILI